MRATIILLTAAGLTLTACNKKATTETSATTTTAVAPTPAPIPTPPAMPDATTPGAMNNPETTARGANTPAPGAMNNPETMARGANTPDATTPN